MLTKNISEVVSSLKAMAVDARASTATGAEWADTVPASDVLRDHQLREARTHRAYLPTQPAPLSVR
ncbi:hypothetical protein [Caenimonas aquaedulcis]|uniref:Uncharacterized protein n=1 Tax=Caenimonas aquaedulcis TaxID=2793270 RepID=A0A931H546_9BURK|nr:hypothetical protein [Caenimonas aquaedulcis]MBG9388657.1 hypothetical protein [Caenimonas aquaedulcis]